MFINEIIKEIEIFAPLNYQESYDNCGVQVGNVNVECSGVLLCLDITEAILDEALQKNCNLIIAHHPLIFKGIKNLTGKNAIEKCIIKAVQNNITLYAAHTNMDNARFGVNYKIAQKLNLIDTKILSALPQVLLKLYTYVPQSHFSTVQDALFNAGAGAIGNYSECSFVSKGEGSFKGNEQSNPTIGQAGGKRENIEELKLEVIVPTHLKNNILQALHQSHPYEEIAYELLTLNNTNPYLGAGYVGSLKEAMPVASFLKYLKTEMKTQCIRHTALTNESIKKVAVCGGSGSFLLNEAKKAKADIFITADFKYHQFFEAESAIIIADIGHFESEQFTPEIFNDIINKKFPNFAVYLSETNTNPINYYF